MNAVVKNLTGSGYKMGNLFTLTVGELIAKHDTREYYSGRGAKYNSSIRHGNISITMTEKELDAAYRPIAKRLKEKKTAEKRMEIYLKNCNKPSQIKEAVAKAVEIVNEEGANDEHGRYWINVYHGCGVYRLIIKEGKIVASIKGGYYDSCPYGVDHDKWKSAIDKYLEEKFVRNYAGAKADGSGTYFYLRDAEDSHLLKVKEYNVPAPNGNGSYGFIHHNIEVAAYE